MTEKQQNDAEQASTEDEHLAAAKYHDERASEFYGKKNIRASEAHARASSDHLSAAGQPDGYTNSRVDTNSEVARRSSKRAAELERT